VFVFVLLKGFLIQLESSLINLEISLFELQRVAVYLEMFITASDLEISD
jgi:hypothetical protein